MKTLKAFPMLEKPRYVNKSDVARIIECEKSKLELDPDFDVMVKRADVLDECDLTQLIAQRRDEKANTYDTRTVVIESKLTQYQRQLVGAMTWELQPDGYEIVFLTTHSDAPPETRQELVKTLMGKADANDKLRKNVRMYVRDGDWETVKTLQSLGWSLKQLVDHFPGSVDAYLCVFTSKTAGKSNNEAMEGVD